MKNYLITAGLTAALTAGSAMPAQAINKEWSAVAGFVGGVLVANAANCNTRTYYRAPTRVVYQPAPVVYQQAPVVHHYHHQPAVVVHHERAPRRGHYEYRTERIWVPGMWVVHDDGCGRSRRVWNPGHYQTSHEKVWVSAGCGPRW